MFNRKPAEAKLYNDNSEASPQGREFNNGYSTSSPSGGSQNISNEIVSNRSLLASAVAIFNDLVSRNNPDAVEPDEVKYID